LDALPRTPENLALIEKVQAAVTKYADLGIRIEDSFLLEASGLRRLSSNVPRTIDEVEAFMRARTAPPSTRARCGYAICVDIYHDTVQTAEAHSHVRARHRAHRPVGSPGARAVQELHLESDEQVRASRVSRWLGSFAHQGLLPARRGIRERA